jgi:hypothetical protein
MRQYPDVIVSNHRLPVRSRMLVRARILTGLLLVAALVAIACGGDVTGTAPCNCVEGGIARDTGTGGLDAISEQLPDSVGVGIDSVANEPESNAGETDTAFHHACAAYQPLRASSSSGCRTCFANALTGPCGQGLSSEYASICGSKFDACDSACNCDAGSCGSVCDCEEACLASATKPDSCGHLASTYYECVVAACGGLCVE